MPTSAEHHLRALAELCKKRPQVFGYPVQRLTTPAHGRKHFEKGRGAKPPRGPFPQTSPKRLPKIDLIRLTLDARLF